MKPFTVQQNKRIQISGTVLVMVLLFSSIIFLVQSHSIKKALAISPLHVSGNQLISSTGNPVVLRGVNRPGTEYACIQNWGIFDGPNNQASISAMLTWGVNEVNVPLNEDCWLNVNTGGINPAYVGANYQNAIIAYVNLLESNNIYPVLAYMWGAPGTQQAIDHPIMPDADHAPAFWTSVANTFKGDPNVLFRLQEEPHPNSSADNTTAWQCWANGGQANTTPCNLNYASVGFPSLMATVRATGATNVVQTPGVDWANGMTQFLTYKPTDSNQMAVVDVYGDNTCGNPTCFSNEYAPVASVMPFMAGEFGESVAGNVCGTTADDALMSWFDAHSAGYSMWEWVAPGSTPPCGSLYMILDYTGTPHSPNGVDYKNHLLSFVGTPTPTPTATPTNTPTPPPSNLLINGSFDSGSLTPWTLSVRSPGAGVLSLDTTTHENGTASAKTVITGTSSSWYYVQLDQNNLSMASGHTYTLTFWVKATFTKTNAAEAVIQKNASPWTSYEDDVFSVSTSWAKKTVSFTPNTSDIVELNFNLAQTKGTVWIDAVSFL